MISLVAALIMSAHEVPEEKSIRVHQLVGIHEEKSLCVLHQLLCIHVAIHN